MPDTRPGWLRFEQPSMLRAVRQSMDVDGDSWIYAWTLHSPTNWRLLHREARIRQERLGAIDAGAPVTEAELAALCRAWDADVCEVRVTIPDQRS